MRPIYTLNLVMALLAAAACLTLFPGAATAQDVTSMDAAPAVTAEPGAPAGRARERSVAEISESFEGFLTPRKPVVIGLLLDGPALREDPTERYQAEILEVAGKSFDIRFDRREADWTMAGVDAALDGMLSDSGMDLVITLGLLGSLQACQRGALPRPVIAAQVVEPRMVGLPQRDGKSGVRNLAYLAFEHVVQRDMARFRELAPFSRVTVLVNGLLAESITTLRESLVRELATMGLTAGLVAVGEDPAAVLAAIPADTEAVYFGPMLNLGDDAFAEIVRGVNARRLPSFSLGGPADVRAGVLATLHPEGEARRVGRRLANNAYRILSGTAPESLEVAFAHEDAFMVNLETARTVGLTPHQDLLGQAEVINEEPQTAEREYTLAGAVREALAGNLDLSEKDRELRAAAQNIPAARANLLPQVKAGSTYAAIDDELASAVQPARAWTASITTTQLIYDEMAHANVEIQKRLQAALEHGREGFELDIIKLAAEAYFNVLRAKTLEGVQKSNLRRTLANRSLAVRRAELGVSGPGEVFRWDAQAAQNRIEVVNASALRRAAEMQFNRVLNQEQESFFILREQGLEGEPAMDAGLRIARRLNDQEHERQFRDFLVARGLEEAPELRQLDEAVAAGGRLYTATKRKYYIPTVGLQWELKHKLDTAGKGAEGGLQTMIVPGIPDNSWTVGVQASLPLYAGGKRKADRVQARESLEQMKIKRASAAQKIEQRIRTAARNTAAAHANIGQARAAAEAARKGLELVSDGYGRGVLNVTDLTDAQTAALVAELGAAGAAYQFMLDLMELYRAVGVMEFLEPANTLCPEE